jgi:hypothetical protein
MKHVHHVPYHSSSLPLPARQRQSQATLSLSPDQNQTHNFPSSTHPSPPYPPRRKSSNHHQFITHSFVRACVHSSFLQFGRNAAEPRSSDLISQLAGLIATLRNTWYHHTAAGPVWKRDEHHCGPGLPHTDHGPHTCLLLSPNGLATGEEDEPMRC